MKFRELLDAGVPRKKAMLTVRVALREAGLPHSVTQIYAWCRKFGVDTR